MMENTVSWYLMVNTQYLGIMVWTVYCPLLLIPRHPDLFNCKREEALREPGKIYHVQVERTSIYGHTCVHAVVIVSILVQSDSSIF